ncbi:F0F1 ATP synthase subunit delta [bacterium]|nr:F0F1 ATP synthase subunit delta [bacterium]
MSNSKLIAKRYAKALWSTVKNGSADEFSKNLEELNALIEEDLKLKNLAKSPIFTSDEKLKVFSEIFEKLSFSKEMINFLKLLAEKDRFSLLAEVNEEFRQLYLNSRKTKEAHVQTAYELSQAQKEKITQVLEAALDVKVNLEVTINEALVAGLIVNVDGRSIDASLKSNLNELKQELLHAEA